MAERGFEMKNKDSMLRSVEGQRKEFVRKTNTYSDQMAKKNYILNDSITRRDKTALTQEYVRELNKGLYREEGLDPYDNTPSSSAKGTRSLALQLTNTGYTNKLLERILKSQNNVTYQKSTMKFQDLTLGYLQNIQEGIKQLVSNTTPAKPSGVKPEKDSLEYQVSNLAKALAELNVDGVFRELKGGFSGKLDKMGYGGLIKSMIESVMQDVQSGGFGQTIKSAIQSTMLAALPEKQRDIIERFQADPVKLIQTEFLNKGALSNNPAIRMLFGSHFRGIKPDTNVLRNKVDLDQTIGFNQKSQLALTKIIPDVLFRIESAITGMEQRGFDWDDQEYKTASQMVAKADETMRNTATHVMTEMMNSFNGKLSSALERDYSGRVQKGLVMGADGKPMEVNYQVVAKDKDNIRKVMLQLIRSEGTIRDIAGNNDLYQAAKRFGVIKSDMSDSEKNEAIMTLAYLQTVANSMSARELTSWEEEFIDAKERLHRNTLNTNLDNMTTDTVQLIRSIKNDSRLTASQKEKLMMRAASLTGGVGGTSSGGRSSGSARDIYAEINEIYNQGHELTPEEKEYARIRMSERGFVSKFGDSAEIYKKDILDGSGQIKKAVNPLEARMNSYLRNDYITQADYDAFFSTEDNVPTRNAKRRVTAIVDELDNKVPAAVTLYGMFRDSGFTADAMSAKSGRPIEFWRQKGFPSSPTDLLNCINSDGSINYGKLRELNADFDEAYIGDLEKRQTKSRRDIDIDYSDIGGSVSSLLNDIFKDPKIAKRIGIGGGTAAGLAVGKMLQNAGIVSSPKFGYLLGAVGGGIMSMERYQRKMIDILGPEGDVKGEDGFSNKEILMAKIMTKWLPAIGAGTKVTSASMKFFRAMGPMWGIMGLAPSLLLGLGAGALAPKILDVGRRMLFDDDGEGNKGWMKKLGKMARNIPFIDKYFAIQDNASAENMMADTVRGLLRREEAILAQMRSQGMDKSDHKDHAKYKTQEDKIKKLTRALEELEALDKKENLTELQKSEQANKILEKAFVTIDESKGVTAAANNSMQEFQEKYKERVDLKNRKNAIGGNIANLSFRNSQDDRRKRAGFAYENMFENTGRYRNLNPPSGQDFNAWFEALSETDKVDYLLMNMLSNTRDAEDNKDPVLVVSEILEDYLDKHKEATNFIREIATGDEDPLTNAINGDKYQELRNILISDLPADQKRAKYNAWRDTLEDSEREYVDEALTGSTQLNAIYNHIYNATKPYVKSVFGYTNIGDIEDKTIELINKSLGEESLYRKISANANIGYERVIGNVMRFFNESTTNRHDIEHSRYMIEQLGGLLGGGKGSGNKLTKMYDLRNIKFKNGQSLSAAGCSIVALNNCLVYLGIPTVEIPTLVDIANNYLTSDGGVTSDFYVEVGKKLGLTVTVYNNIDNKFTIESMSTLAPNNQKGLIVLQKNDNNNGSHFVTIKRFAKDKCQVDDPEIQGVTDVTTSTIVVKAIEMITITRGASTSTTLKPYKSTFMNNIHEKITSVKNTISDIKTVSNSIRTKGLFNTAKDAFKNGIGSSFNVGPNATQDANTGLLTSILEKITSIINNGLNVIVVDDMTMALSATDENVATELARSASNNAPNKLAQRAALRVKGLVKNRHLAKEREQSELVQKAIIENGLHAGGSTGEGGKGTGSINDGSGTVNKPGLLGKLGSIAAAAPAFLMALGGAGASLFGVKEGVKNMKFGYRGLVSWGKSLFGKGEADEDSVNEYNEEGRLVKRGQYEDLGGSMRNIRQGYDLARGAAYAGARVLPTAMRGLGNIFKRFGARNATNFVGRAAAAVGKNLADPKGITKMLLGLPKFLWRILDSKPFKLLKRGIPGIESLVGKLMSVFTKIVSKVAPKLGAKFAQLAAKEGGKKAAGQIPIAGLIVTAIQFVSSVRTGYKQAENILGIPDGILADDMSTKWTVGLLKGVYDCMPDFVLGIISTFTAGVGMAATIGISLIVALVQQFFTFRDFLIAWGFDKELMDKQITKEQAQNDLLKYKKNIMHRAEEAAEKRQKMLEEKGLENDGKGNYTGVIKTTSGLTPEEEERRAQAGEYGELETEATKNIETGTTGLGAEFGKKIVDWWKNKKNKQTGNTSSKEDAEVAADIAAMNMKMDGTTIKAANTEYQNLDIDDTTYEKWKANRSKGYYHPAGGGAITSTYGPRNIKGGSNPHKGIDFSTGQNGPVFAYRDGEVVSYGGNFHTLIIKHDDGTSSTYMHLNEALVKPGEKVKGGQKVGLAGGWGIKKGESHPRADAYKPHLHFQINKTPSLDSATMDPLVALGLDPSLIRTEGNNNAENREYINRNAWLAKVAKAKVEAAKTASENTGNKGASNIQSKEAGGSSKYDDLETTKSINEATRREAARIADNIDILRGIKSSSAGVEQKLTVVISLLSRLLSATEDNLNNTLLDGAGPATINNM